MFAYVKRAIDLQPGDVVNVGGSGFMVEHVAVYENRVSIIAKAGGRVVRYAHDDLVEYVTAGEWEKG